MSVLPIKEAVLDMSDTTLGLKMISFVADPAISIDFIKFDEHKQIKMSIQDKEKGIVVSPVLIPNQLVYRKIKDQNTGLTEEFNLFFSAETIFDIALKFNNDNLGLKADIEHDGNLVEGVSWFERVILSKDRYAAPKGFEGLPDGTLVFTGKVTNPILLDKIEKGEVRGLSIDGAFKAMNVQQKSELTDEDIIKLCSHF